MIFHFLGLNLVFWSEVEITDGIFSKITFDYGWFCKEFSVITICDSGFGMLMGIPVIQ